MADATAPAFLFGARPALPAQGRGKPKRGGVRANRRPARLDAVRGHLFQMAGDPERAIAHYRAAAERTASIPERDYLTAKADRLAAELHRPS